MARAEESKLARKLARLVLDAGEARLTELRPALEKILEGRSVADRKAFLKAFHKAATREVARDTLTIESAVELSPESSGILVNSFSAGRERPLQVIHSIRPDLIAGVRVRLGDTVYDASVAHRLNTLARSIH